MTLFLNFKKWISKICKNLKSSLEQLVSLRHLYLNIQIFPLSGVIRISKSQFPECIFFWLKVKCHQKRATYPEYLWGFFIQSPIELKVIYDAFSTCSFPYSRLCLSSPPAQTPVKLLTAGAVQKEKLYNCNGFHRLVSNACPQILKSK